MTRSHSTQAGFRAHDGPTATKLRGPPSLEAFATTLEAWPLLWECAESEGERLLGSASAA
jgi:hypothetical protein